MKEYEEIAKSPFDKGLYEKREDCIIEKALSGNVADYYMMSLRDIHNARLTNDVMKLFEFVKDIDERLTTILKQVTRSLTCWYQETYYLRYDLIDFFNKTKEREEDLYDKFPIDTRVEGEHVLKRLHIRWLSDNTFWFYVNNIRLPMIKEKKGIVSDLLPDTTDKFYIPYSYQEAVDNIKLLYSYVILKTTQHIVKL